MRHDPVDRVEPRISAALAAYIVWPGPVIECSGNVAEPVPFLAEETCVSLSGGPRA